MTCKIPQWDNKKFLDLWQFGIWIMKVLLLIVVPMVFLKELLPNPLGIDVYPPKTFQRHWELRGVDLYIDATKEGHIPIINGFVLYGLEKEELQTTKLDYSFSIPRSFVAKILKLPEEPIDHELCIYLRSYFESSTGERVYLPKQTVRLLIEGMPVQEMHDGDCLPSSSSMTLVGIAPGGIPMEYFEKGVNRTGVIVFSGANLQVDNAAVGTGAVFNYRSDGISIWLNGHEFKGIMGKQDGGKYFKIDWGDKNLLIQLKSVQELSIKAKPAFTQVLVLGIALLAAWWILSWSFLGNLEKAWKELVKPAIQKIHK